MYPQYKRPKGENSDPIALLKKKKKGKKKKHVLMFDRHLPRCITIHQIDLACPLVLKASRQTNLVNECKHAHCTYPTGTLEENSRKQTIIIIRALITIEK